MAIVFGCALAPAGALAYLIGQHTLIAAFDDVIRFTLTRYGSVNKVWFGFGKEQLNVPLVYAFRLAPVLTIAVFAYDWRAFFPISGFGCA